MSSLNPSLTVGLQIAEPINLHRRRRGREAPDMAVELLGACAFPTPKSRLDAYPHQYSGGMRQRVMIAMALACQPQLIIADEPTTALDVTVQAQILALLKELTRETDSAHDPDHPRSRRRGALRRPRRRDVRRPHRRGRRRRASSTAAAPSLHARPDGLGAAPRRRGRPRAGADRGPAARPRQPAAGLRLRAALPTRRDRLPQRTSAAGRERSRASLGLSLPCAASRPDTVLASRTSRSISRSRRRGHARQVGT